MSYDPSQPEWTYRRDEWVSPPPPPPRRRGRLWAALAVLVVVATGASLAAANRQYLSDVWTVWHFDVTPVLQGYIDRTTMTDHGAFLFEASTPVVAGAEDFNAVCASLEAGSGVLGCYQGGERTITLYDITDPRLDGKEEVVAAHEMLHAAWDRLGQDERKRLTPLLEEAAAALADDPDFTERMDLYARAEPGQRVNELHSIIGTEVADLSPALEEYYAQYFRDRAALVALHVSSNEVFRQIEEQSAALVQELEALNEGMEADYKRYNDGYDALNADIEDFNARAESGDFDSPEQFNAERGALVQRRDDLDALLADIQSRKVTYDAKVDQLEAVNAEAAKLNESINIVPRAPEPTG